MTRALLLAGLLVVACGPGPGGTDGGIDGAIPNDAGSDASLSCVGMPEGAYVCTPEMQCCGGTWRSILDGPCFPRPLDGGPPRDAGPPDCAARAERAGCPCTAGSADVCVPFSDSLRCTSGTWTTLVGISCCVMP